MIAVSSSLNDCQDLGGDWNKIVEMASQFTNPISFAFHVGADLLVNGVQIYDDITGAINDFK